MSSFAFKFLLSIFEYLKKQAENHITDKTCETCAYSVKLRDRIKHTCKAHLEWVKAVERLPTKGGCFWWNYWATGKLIMAVESDSRPDSPDSPASMHFQILKYASYALKWDEQDVKDTFEKEVKVWIEELDARNTRGFSAFAAYLLGVGDLKYRLEDHVWIWRLLRSVEKLGLGQLITTKRKSIKDEKSSLSEDYSAVEFRRKVLRRFTTENSISKQRMIAVRRSLSQTRFEFRARDTALYYDKGEPFFEPDDPLWNATLESQRLHVENQDARWHDPLRYTLALLMGTMNQRINPSSAADSVRTAEKVLYQSSSRNGLLPGELNEETKEAQIFQAAEMRDYYWHVSFEVPYALLYANGAPKEEQTSEKESSNETAKKKKPNKAADGATKGEQASENKASDQTAKKKKLDRAADEKFLLVREKLTMKRSIPFNSLVEKDSIVLLSDEWLYPAPSFLQWPRKNHDLFNPDSHDGNIWEFCLKSPKEDHLGVVIFDIPKRKSNMASRSQSQDNQVVKGKPLSSDGMHKRLEAQRTAYSAKKRLLWCWNQSACSEKLYTLATPKANQHQMNLFFERHKRREKYFFDETTAAANLWETEFHLSSYQLLVDDLGKFRKDHDLHFLGNRRLIIRRAATGFRIVGDFFDRYWTCYVLEYEPLKDLQGKTLAEDEFTERFKEIIKLNDISPVSGKRIWDQRKVLELLLFGRMLQNIKGRYEQLFKKIESRLESLSRRARPNPNSPNSNPPGSNSPNSNSPNSNSSQNSTVDIVSVSNQIFSSLLKYKDYSRLNEQWPAFQYTLQVMEEDLADTFEKIDLWATREADRKLERPRWTRNDESRYRSAIAKLTTANNHKIRELKRYRSDIKSLRVSIAERLQSTRDNLSFESSEHVRFFTYVTVVFLPMGFATALFSMSAAPAGKIVREMVKVALISLMVTVVVLACARNLVGILVNIVGIFGKPVRFLFNNLVLLPFYKLVLFPFYGLVLPLFYKLVLPTQEHSTSQRDIADEEKKRRTENRSFIYNIGCVRKYLRRRRGNDPDLP